MLLENWEEFVKRKKDNHNLFIKLFYQSIESKLQDDFFDPLRFLLRRDRIDNEFESRNTASVVHALTCNLHRLNAVITTRTGEKRPAQPRGQRRVVTGCIEQEGRSAVRLGDERGSFERRNARLNDACRKDEQDGGCSLVNSRTQCRGAGRVLPRDPLGQDPIRMAVGITAYRRIRNLRTACALFTVTTIRFSMPGQGSTLLRAD